MTDTPWCEEVGEYVAVDEPARETVAVHKGLMGRWLLVSDS